MQCPCDKLLSFQSSRFDVHFSADVHKAIAYGARDAVRLLTGEEGGGPPTGTNSPTFNCN